MRSVETWLNGTTIIFMTITNSAQCNAQLPKAALALATLKLYRQALHTSASVATGML